MNANVQNLITQYAAAAGVDPSLALAVANHESGGDQSAVGAAGEIGVFQLLPSSFPGVDIRNLQANVQSGVSYLRSLLLAFGGDAQKALAAYNWGPPRVAAVVAQYGPDWFSHIPGQVQGYVQAVLAGGGIVGSIMGAITSIFGGELTPGALPGFSAAPGPAASGTSLSPWVVILGAGALAYFLFTD